ncbi:MAG: DUF3450 domain-containing protein [Planctomycetes bacterium]|nr:DUF3450 domain-containing protein [Planctomycetota bacterium]
MIRANDKKEVTTLIEEWAGHFGTSDDRQNGTREICFDESTIDVADQITMCLEGISVIPELFMDSCLSKREQNGLCMITQMITQAASKAINFLYEDHQSERGRNGALRREVESLQAENEQIEQRAKQAERAADPGILQTIQATESTRQVYVLFMDAVNKGALGQGASNAYDELISKLAEIEVSPGDVIDHLAKAGHEATLVTA